MKKLIYFLPFVALAMASCSNEVLDQQPALTQDASALVIRPAVQGLTRGTVTTDANLTVFHATATAATGDFFLEGTDAATATQIASIDGNVQKDGSKWIFNDGKTYWWESKNTEANFKAYAPADISLTAFTVAPEIADQKDVIVAYNEGKGGDFTSGVPLNFQHVLSQIVIKALNKDASTFKVEVAGVKLTNIANKGSLTLPEVSTASPFDWTKYPTVWTLDGSSVQDKYTAGSNQRGATSGTTLTASAAAITSEPFLLMPQQLTAAADLSDATNSGTKSVTGTYLSVLIRATDLSQSVPEQNVDGKYLLASDGSAIDFDAKSENNLSDFDTYDASKLDATAGTYNSAAIKMVNPVVYPREGYGNNSVQYAYVCVPLDTEWLPGYKYTYTLNFSKDGIGKIDPNFAGGTSGANYPGGTGGLKPGEEIIDNPIELFFTVTVDSWTDATPENKDM